MAGSAATAEHSSKGGLGTCSSPGCGKQASLRCPTCVKLELPKQSSLFCDQPCFRASWKLHKAAVHSLTLPVSSLNKLDTPVKQQMAFASFDYTGPLRTATVTQTRPVPTRIPRPDYYHGGVPRSEEVERRAFKISALNEKEIEGMRKVCRLAREVLDIAGRAVAVGVTTDEIDAIVHQACLDRESYPSPLNYYGFPKSCCTSVNEVICHGIPDTRPLEDGDIVNIDITLFHGGFHGDLNETYLVGNVSDESKSLIRSAYECLMAGIALVKPGTMYREIGGAVEGLAKQNGHSVVRSYCGHGISQYFHCSPNVPHYKRNKAQGICKPGHTFTIEPMLAEGSWKDITWPDNWTAVTADGRRSAQFEQTLLVTEDGVEILTGKIDSSPKFFWEN